MRQLILGLIYFGTILTTFGQDVKIERSTEKGLLISPDPIYKVRTFTDKRYIGIKVIELHNLIGVHPDPDSVDQEVALSDFLLLVKERFDNNGPDASANFWVKGKFYNPRDFNFRNEDKSLSFKHGPIRKPKTTTLIISTKEIKLK
jgi:hypothetical protein